MRTLAATCATWILAIPLLAADATGKWEAAIPSPRGEMILVFDLKAEGETLTGTVSNEIMGESEIVDGKIDGHAISFKQELERGPRSITFAYTGAIDGDEMELTRTVESFSGDAGAAKGGPRGKRGGGMGREVAFVAKRLK